MSRFVPTVKVEVYFGRNDFTTGEITGTWEDITPYVMSITTNRGYNYETAQLEAGTATLRLRNEDRRFDPTYSGSPYAPYVSPYRKIRITSTGWTDPGDVGFGLDPAGAIWTGYVERWPISWDGPVAGFVDITCVDLVAMLSQAQINETFAQERTDERVFNVLDGIVDYALGGTGWAGQSTVPAATFNNDKGALEHIREVMVSEGSGSAVFLRSDGEFAFSSRWYGYVPFTENPGDYTVPTFTDSTLGTARYPYQDLRPSFDPDRVRSQVTVTSSAGTVTVEDAAAIGRYGKRPEPLEPLFDSGADVEDVTNYALWELAHRKEARLRLETMTLRPTTEAMWAAVVLLEISSLVVVERTYPAIPETTDLIRNMVVQSIQHRISHPGTDWEVTLGLYHDYSAQSGADSPWFILGSSALSDGAAVIEGSEIVLNPPRLAY